jgi:hypothetical protein
MNHDEAWRDSEKDNANKYQIKGSGNLPKFSSSLIVRLLLQIHSTLSIRQNGNRLYKKIAVTTPWNGLFSIILSQRDNLPYFCGNIFQVPQKNPPWSTAAPSTNWS